MKKYDVVHFSGRPGIALRLLLGLGYPHTCITSNSALHPQPSEIAYTADFLTNTMGTTPSLQPTAL